MNAKNRKIVWQNGLAQHDPFRLEMWEIDGHLGERATTVLADLVLPSVLPSSPAWLP
jgi:hypothetical protein